MGSFVPLGGFFSSPQIKGSFSSSYQCVTRGSMSSENFEGKMTSVSINDKQKTTLSPRLHIAESGANNMSDNLKVCIISSNIFFMEIHKRF